MRSGDGGGLVVEERQLDGLRSKMHEFRRRRTETRNKDMDTQWMVCMMATPATHTCTPSGLVGDGSSARTGDGGSPNAAELNRRGGRSKMQGKECQAPSDTKGFPNFPVQNGCMLGLRVEELPLSDQTGFWFN